jgi:hypothetical protein
MLPNEKKTLAKRLAPSNLSWGEIFNNIPLGDTSLQKGVGKGRTIF